MTFHRQQAIKLEFAFDLEQKCAFDLAKIQITDENWDETHWKLKTPMLELLEELSLRRNRLRIDSSCDALLKYFSLLYVFEESSRHYRLAYRECSGVNRSLCFVWKVSCFMTRRRFWVTFHWSCVHWELFFVGVKLGALLFKHTRLDEAAIVYHMVINNMYLCQTHSDSTLEFLSAGWHHESEFCLLVERANEILESEANDEDQSALCLCVCNRLHHLVAESPLLDARYCQQLQTRVSRKMPSRLMQRTQNANEMILESDSDTGADENIVTSNGVKEQMSNWFLHVANRQSRTSLLEMISSNIDNAICQQNNRNQCNKD